MPQYIFHKCANGNYVMAGPYNVKLVEDLKEGLDWWQRAWDPMERVWQIEKSAFRQAAEICMRYGTVNFEGEDPNEPERQRQAEAQAEREHQARKERAQEHAKKEQKWQEQHRRERDRQANESYQRQQRQQREQTGWRDNWNQNTTTSQSNGASNPYQVLHLQPGAPLEVVKAAYKALALTHHPDRGGDEERMKQVNIAFDTILRQRGER